jgi:Asp-tRNA(Asn)/Glu-tRNA(Gln) amidotransferase A subunit family amidase
MLAALAKRPTDAAVSLAEMAAALHCVVSFEENELGPGPLSGLTYLAKDLLDVPGRAPSLGLAAADAPPPGQKAALLDTLDQAGAKRVGFCEMTALACEPSGSNPGRRRPLNPWNPDRICGGSSSGSAVAVAAGLVDFAIGSDTAGSLRIPAHCCGVTAWKPTPGLIPIDGAMALAPSLDVLGFMARDAGTLLQLAHVFAADAAPSPAQRIAVADDLMAQSNSGIASACAALAEALVQGGGRLASDAFAPLLSACDPHVLDLLQAEIAAQHGWRLHDGTLDAMLEARLRKGLAIPAARMAQAREHLRQIASELTIFRDHDAILLPVMQSPTPEVALCEPGSASFSARTLYGLSAYTRFVNGLGLPAVALPCGFDDNGMPIAAQLVGPPGSDLALLRVAVEAQRATAWHGREPAALAAILEAAR